MSDWDKYTTGANPRLNEMTDDEKGLFIGFTSGLIDKLRVLNRRVDPWNAPEPTPLTFAEYVEEVKGECLALGRLASLMDGTAVLPDLENFLPPYKSHPRS